MLPLAGRGNSPLKMVSRHNSVSLNNKLTREESVKEEFSPFRANQFKETLPLKPKQDPLPLSPRDLTIEQSKAHYIDAPIVTHTMSNSFSRNFQDFSKTVVPGESHMPAVIDPYTGQQVSASVQNKRNEGSNVPHTNHFTSSVSHWRATRGLDSPLDKAKNMDKVPNTLFSPTKIQSPAELMNRSFNNYEAYKRDLSPSASKTEYRNFLSEVQKTKVTYDSNVSHALDHHKKVIAFKNKEQGLRTRALQMNAEH